MSVGYRVESFIIDSIELAIPGTNIVSNAFCPPALLVVPRFFFCFEILSENNVRNRRINIEHPNRVDLIFRLAKSHRTRF